MSAGGGSRLETWGSASIALLLLSLIAPPLLFLLYASAHESLDDGSFGVATLEHYTGIFGSRAFWSHLGNSVAFSLGSAVLAIFIGGGQAWLAERTDAPFRGLMYLTAFVSLGIPYVLYIVSWLLLLGKAGSLNTLAQSLFGFPLVNIYSLGGMIFVEAMIWAPLAFLLLVGVFRNADASFEEAAMTAGANVLGTLRHITLGMSRPALAALSILVFIKAIEAFEAPALVGLPGSVRVLTTVVYENVEAYIPPRIGQAAAFGVLLLCMTAVLLRIYARISADAHKYRSVSGKGFRPRRMELGRFRWVAGAFAFAFALLVILLPLLVIVWAALLPFYQPFKLSAVASLNFDNFVKLANSGAFTGAIANSLVLGVSVATIVTALCSFAGWLVARRARGSQFVEQLSSAPLTFPAIVMGLAYLQIFVHGGNYLYGSLASLVLVSFVACLPYGMRYAQLGVLQIHPELEEAGAVAGATRWTVFRAIVLPLIAPALISTWLFVFLLSVRSVSMLLLLVGPDSQVVAVSLFELWNNGQIGEVAALGLVWTGIMSVLSCTFLIVARRYGLPMG